MPSIHHNKDIYYEDADTYSPGSLDRERRGYRASVGFFVWDRAGKRDMSGVGIFALLEMEMEMEMEECR